MGNYFEYRQYSSLNQTCGPLHDFTTCQELKAGENFPALNADGSVAGWHNSTRPHPCAGINWGCMQSEGGGKMSCLQGSKANCNKLCDDLNLLDVYQHDCYS